MAFDYTNIETVLNDIDSNYSGWKQEPGNHYRHDYLEDKTYIETIVSPMVSSVITYLYQNHNTKKMLEIGMGMGLLKFHNADSGSNLSIDSACWKREWHSVDLSNTSEINQKSDEYRGLTNIKIKQQLNVQADYIFKVGGDPLNWLSLTVQNSPSDSTLKNLNDYDMLIFKNPDRSLFDNVASFKTSTSFTGSILFYDVGVLTGRKEKDFSSYVDENEGSSTYGWTFDQIYPDQGVSESSILPSHTELNFSNTRGFLIP